MKASSNSNILTTGLLSLSLVVLFSSCSKESVEPISQTSTSTSNARKLVKVEKPFSNPNSNEFGTDPSKINEENTEVQPFTNNLSGINPKTSGGDDLENGIGSPSKFEENSDVEPYTNNLHAKDPNRSGGNGEDFIKKENKTSERMTDTRKIEIRTNKKFKFKKTLIPSKY